MVTTGPARIRGVQVNNRSEPDEHRLAPHGTLAYDWTRKDG